MDDLIGLSQSPHNHCPALWGTLLEAIHKVYHPLDVHTPPAQKEQNKVMSNGPHEKSL